ncbi:hypothetical protein C9F11_46795 (plasmid) [Streptomyces sp. YIM 121038]|nr:hypothetical protein C9F11_46795 [Streptomyces sp. YIM 121038]
MDADEVAASMAFATVAVHRATRMMPAQATAPEDPWATARGHGTVASEPSQGGRAAGDTEAAPY